MNTKEKITQKELARRASDDVGFVDNQAIDQVLALIVRANRDAEIEFGYSLTQPEIEALRVKLNIKNRHLQKRTSFVLGIRLADGAGTLIIIGSKK